MKRFQHFLGLGWDVTAAGVVHYWTRLIFGTIIIVLSDGQNQLDMGPVDLIKLVPSF
jgi:hypothetical protein